MEQNYWDVPPSPKQIPQEEALPAVIEEKVERVQPVEAPKSPEAEVIEGVFRDELVHPPFTERIKGLWDKMGLFTSSIFSKDNAKRALKGLGASGSAAVAAIKNWKENPSVPAEPAVEGPKPQEPRQAAVAPEQKAQAKDQNTVDKNKEKEIKPGESIKDFLSNQFEKNNASIEKAGFKKALHGFFKNAPARILTGAALGALGPLGHLGKYTLTAVGGALMGQGVAQTSSESKALEKISKVGGVRNEKTGEYHSEKLAEELAKLNAGELSNIVGGLSQIATQRGLKIAKETAELGKGIENNKKYAFLQEKFDKLPKFVKSLTKALPIVGGAALFIAPFALPMAAAGITAMIAGSVGLSLVGSVIERVSHGPKSIGKYYNHSEVVTKAVDELEKRMVGKSDEERIAMVKSIGKSRSGVTKAGYVGTALGIAGLEAFQFAVPQAVHGMSNAYNHLSSLFANGGLPAVDQPAVHHENLNVSTAEPLANTSDFKDIPSVPTAVETQDVFPLADYPHTPNDIFVPHETPHVSITEPIANTSDFKDIPSVPTAVETQDVFPLADYPHTPNDIFVPHETLSPIVPHFGNELGGMFDTHIPVMLPVQPEHGLHLVTLGGGHVLHYEGAANAEHPSSAGNSLAHEVVAFSAPNEQLTPQQQNLVAQKLLEDWVHRGLFHTDGSLVQDGKEHLVDKINALKEFHAAAQGVLHPEHIGAQHLSSAVEQSHTVQPHTPTPEHAAEATANNAKSAATIHEPLRTLANNAVQTFPEPKEAVVQPLGGAQPGDLDTMQFSPFTFNPSAAPIYNQEPFSLLTLEPEVVSAATPPEVAISHIPTPTIHAPEPVPNHPSVAVQPSEIPPAPISVPDTGHDVVYAPPSEAIPTMTHHPLSELGSSLENLRNNELRVQQLPLTGKEAADWQKIDASIYSYANLHNLDKDLTTQFITMMGNGGGTPVLPKEMGNLASLMQDSGNRAHFVNAVTTTGNWASGE